MLSEIVKYELTDWKTSSLLYKSHGEFTDKGPFSPHDGLHLSMDLPHNEFDLIGLADIYFYC